MWPNSSYYIMKLRYWTLRSGSPSSLRSMACSLRSAGEARRSKLLGIHLCWQSNNKSSILLLGCVRDEVLFTDLLLCCHGGLLHGFHFSEAVYIVLQTVVFLEQKCMLRVILCSSGWSSTTVSSQELSVVGLGNWQDVSFCLIEASRRINRLQLVDQCPLFDQTVHQPTWCPWETSRYLCSTWLMV